MNKLLGLTTFLVIVLVLIAFSRSNTVSPADATTKYFTESPVSPQIKAIGCAPEKQFFPTPPGTEEIFTNDNKRSAGVLKDGSLTINLKQEKACGFLKHMKAKASVYMRLQKKESHCNYPGVVTDLCGGEIGVPGLVVVGVDTAQAGGVRADGAVGEQVAGRAQCAELASPFDATELAPVADDVRPRFLVGEGEHGAEVVLAGDVRAAELVQCPDAQFAPRVAGSRAEPCAADRARPTRGPPDVRRGEPRC